MIAGVDEAGRGPLAGPVVAAACILPPGLVLEGLRDSKQLSPRQRQQLFVQLCHDQRVIYGLGIVTAQQIDASNILQATLAAMQQALAALAVVPSIALIDGQHCPQLPYRAVAIVKGDALHPSIAAASILAKVQRDAIMLRFHQRWPSYRFDLHKGYGTLLHRQKIAQLGPLPIHRRTFAPLRGRAL